ncbi:MAG TPA: hypothetical protein VE620_12760 [Myxococcales bacterium]|jgi:hypothetical protein|nr:hypothetical protein [Myxococcales bacterium]
MKNMFVRMLLVIAGAGLAACDGKVLYGRADEPSIVFTQPESGPGDPTQTPITIPTGVVTFTFDIPDIPLTGGSTSSNQSGFAITTMMRLNQTVFTITSPSSGADFNGLQSVTLTIQSGSNSATLATYTKDPANPPDKTLVLKGDPNVELLDFAAPGVTGGKTITVSVSVTGTLPVNNWTADVDMDLHVQVTAGWP